MSSKPVRVVQELARHSDPRLTMNTYAHVRLFDAASALKALPSSKPAVEAHMLQTGTDNVPLGRERATPAQHSGRGEGQTRALGLRRGDRSIATTDRQKLLENTTQCADLHAFSDTCGKATSETRTPDLSFTKRPASQPGIENHAIQEVSGLQAMRLLARFWADFAPERGVHRARTARTCQRNG